MREVPKNDASFCSRKLRFNMHKSKPFTIPFTFLRVVPKSKSIFHFIPSFLSQLIKHVPTISHPIRRATGIIFFKKHFFFLQRLHFHCVHFCNLYKKSPHRKNLYGDLSNFQKYPLTNIWKYYIIIKCIEM